MRIAMVFDGLQVGGIERVGIDYIKLMQELGHEVFVFNLRPKLNEMEKELPDNTEIIHFNFSRKLAPEQYAKLVKTNFIGKLAYPVAYAGLTAIDEVYKVCFRHTKAGKNDFDVVIAFSGHFNDLTFVASGFVKAKKKICWLHGALYSYILMSDGYLNLYKKIKNLVVLVDNLQEEVFAYNKNLKLQITKLYNPSFVSDREIDEEKVAMLKEKYGDFLMMVGRLAKDKDQMTLIKAVKYLKDTYNFQEKLVFVGDGTERLKLEKAVEEAGLESSVFFEGNCLDVQNYYSAATLFVHSSPLEGLPTTLIEALYYQLPIVATDSIPGVREILGNNEYGMITPTGDFREMGECIYKMYHNDALYNSYKEKSRERFKDFSPGCVRRKLQALLLQ